MVLFACEQGFGMLLMEEAERIAREEHGSNKIVVISGMFYKRITAIRITDISMNTISTNCSSIYVILFCSFRSWN